MAASTNEAESSPTADPDQFPPKAYPRYEDPNRNKVYYSPTSEDDRFQYRCIVVPDEFKKKLTGCHDHHFTTIAELRNHGVIIHPGWGNSFSWHAPRQSPTFLLRRPLNMANDEFLNPLDLPVMPGFSATASTAQQSSTAGHTRHKSYRDEMFSVLDGLDEVSRKDDTVDKA